MKNSLNKKIISFILIAVFILIIFFCSEKLYSIYKEKQNEKDLLEEREKISESMVFKNSYKYIDDGWYYSISSNRWEEEVGEYSYNYSFGGCNIKYGTLEDNYAMYIDSNNEENNYKIPASPPTLNTSYKSKDGIVTEETERRNLDAVLEDKKWNRKITEDDLSEIVFVNFNKDDIIELWNNMYEEDYSNVAGAYISLNACTLRKENKENDSYQVGVYLAYGFIKDVRIDYIDNNGEYLTDKIENGTATEEEIALYKNIELIEEGIIESGSFDVEEKFDDLKSNTSMQRIFDILNDIEKSREKQ